MMRARLQEDGDMIDRRSTSKREQLQTLVKSISVIVVAWLCVSASPNTRTAGDAPQGEWVEQRDSLKGLKGVHVIIGKISPDTERAGLYQEQIRVDTELNLRRSGIRVLTADEWLNEPGAPALQVDVAVVGPADAPMRGYSITVLLIQGVSLLRAPAVRGSAPTWQVGAPGVVGAAKTGNLRGEIHRFVDWFVNDYLAVNPK
jgi:hypothetical protein